ncbi:hypothetical protein HUW51_21275 [Adhaeribacter swui]|uniref:Uncharacterized protein n=1 Tax=Adhaeribacter swui TaxID=2086471 RepID=A0A7G7GD91_9BACT|nr:hypothetical protein [Adhaeribacter swui]QNF35125.1 hypothetical protein HUW51_21275 [Adhaeribacter swui]
MLKLLSSLFFLSVIGLASPQFNSSYTIPIQENPKTFKELLTKFKDQPIALYLRSTGNYDHRCKIIYVGDDYVKIKLSGGISIFPVNSINDIHTRSDNQETIIHIK